MEIGSSKDHQAKVGINGVVVGLGKVEKVERRGGLGSGMVEMEEGRMWEQGRRYP